MLDGPLVGRDRHCSSSMSFCQEPTRCGSEASRSASEYTVLFWRGILILSVRLPESSMHCKILRKARPHLATALGPTVFCDNSWDFDSHDERFSTRCRCRAEPAIRSYRHWRRHLRHVPDIGSGEARFAAPATR